MFRTTLLRFAICLVVLASNSPAETVGQQPDAGLDTLVVCPLEFQQALQPWVNYRTEQGHKIEIILPQTAEELRKTIRSTASQNNQLKTVVLVGDSHGDLHTVPTHIIESKVGVLFGSQPNIATDNPYADLDGDGSPDLAIGRLTVDSSAELTKTIERIVAYERDTGDEWLQRINFVAGVGGFGQFIDKLIEQTAKKMITEIIPSGYNTTMTYGSWSSPYCPDPSKFDAVTIDKFNEGCLFWVYIGHGATHFLDHVRLPDRSYRILDTSNVQELDAVGGGSPIAIFLACNTGAFDHPTDCLSEMMLKQDKGPIAVLASTRVVMPYGLSLFTLGMCEDYFEGGSETLGELVRVAKCKLIATDENPSEYRQTIETIGRGFSPKPELLVAERREHADLIHLLGDPLLRIKRPEKLGLVSEIDEQNGTIQLTGRAPFAGKAKIAISFKRNRFRVRPPRRSVYNPNEFESYQETYEQVQQLSCSEETKEFAAGDFNVAVAIPESAQGECVVQVYLQGETGFAIDSVPVLIER